MTVLLRLRKVRVHADSVVARNAGTGPVSKLCLTLRYAKNRRFDKVQAIEQNSA